jgi:hypothetical protein
MCRAIDADSPSVVELLQKISEVYMTYATVLAQYVNHERVGPSQVKAQVIETLDFLHTIISNAKVRDIRNCYIRYGLIKAIFVFDPIETRRKV